MSLFLGTTKVPQLNIHKTSGSGTGNYQDKTVSPALTSLLVEADQEYDALSSVTINAIPTATQATPTINVSNSTGVITASATQSAGYVSAGTKTATSQLSVEAEKTVTPSSTSQTAVAAGKFTTGAITVAAVPTETKSISSNGTYTPSTGKYFSSVTVDVSSTINNQNKTVNPSTSQQTVQADSGYSGLGTVTVTAMPAMTLPTTTAASATSGYTSKATVSRSTSDQYINIPTGYNSSGAYYKVSAVPNGTEGTPTATKGTVSNHSISVTPSVTNTAGYISGGTKTGTAVTVSASELVSGTKSITANGTGIDVTNYATVDVSVSGGGPTINSLTVTPSESEQTFNSASVDGYKPVTVEAISSTYVGSGITRRDDTDLTASGATVTVPAGYYEDEETKSISSGSATTPATTVTANPTISVNTTTGLITATASATKSVTPTVSAGYVSSGTAGTITVSGSNTSQLSTVGGSTITPTESEQTAVAANKYTLGAIKVGAISSTYVGTGVTRRDDTDLTASGATVTVPAGYYEDQETKSVSSMTLPTTTSSSATSGYTSKATVSRSTSDQYINIPPGYNSAGGYYKINAVANGSATGPSSLSGSSATISTGTNTITLTKTGVTTTPTVSAGYVSSATASSATVALTASVSVNPTPTASGATVTIPEGYYSSQTTKSVTSGSATAPATISGTSATVSHSGTTITLNKTVSVTPTVSAGYVSSGTAGNSSVSLSATDANFVASNILSTATIFGLTGSVVTQNCYVGSSTPASSTGSNGDIYIKTS